MLKLENFLKGVALTIIGIVVICFAFYGWWEDMLTDMQAVGAGIAGFALMFMRTKLDDFISRLFDALIEKFFGKGNGSK